MTKENAEVTYLEISLNEVLEFAGRKRYQIKRVVRGSYCNRDFRAYWVEDGTGNETILAGIKNGDGRERVSVPNLLLEDFKNLFIGGRGL